MKNISITAIIQKTPEGGYIGQLQEFPEVLSQGKTVDELKENLEDALNLILETRRKTTIEAYKGMKTIKQKLVTA